MAATRTGLLAHNVFFSLHDRSETARAALIKACQTMLAPHPGVVYFACGSLCPDLTRDLNDLEWDVGLHMVFADRAAHDAYQTTPDHLKFIEQNKGGWKRVRVFDTNAASSPPTA